VCSNVLLSEDFRACLADLGMAQTLGTGSHVATGFSRLYAAPEQLMEQPCSLAADMYSFGLLLTTLLTQQLVEVRGGWRLPRAPQECPQVRSRAGSFRRVGRWVGGCMGWRVHG